MGWWLGLRAFQTLYFHLMKVKATVSLFYFQSIKRIIRPSNDLTIKQSSQCIILKIVKKMSSHALTYLNNIKCTCGNSSVSLARAMDNLMMKSKDGWCSNWKGSEWAWKSDPIHLFFTWNWFSIEKGWKQWNLIKIATKGQLISKCPFGVIIWTKIPTKYFPGFLP